MIRLPAKGARNKSMRITSTNLLIADTSIGIAPKGRYGGIASGLVYHALRNQLPIHTIVACLRRACEVAYEQRESNTLAEASLALCNLPNKGAKQLGSYYQAIIAHRTGDKESARLQVELLTESSTPLVRARAFQTLATMHYEQGEYEKARRIYAKVKESPDVFARAGAILHLSALASAEGNHRVALDALQMAWPIVRHAAHSHSYLFYVFANDLAWELLNLGRIDEAAKYSAIATGSALASAYPEWRETRDTIAERQAAPVIIAIETPIGVTQDKGREAPLTPAHPLAAGAPVSAAAEILTPRTSIISRVQKRAPPTGPPFV
jgi:tetratricopeptide (TPR) repeat protein